MSNIKIVDASGQVVEIQARGTGTESDPFVQTQDVMIQDQATPMIIASMSNETGSTTLATLGAIGDLTFDVADATGFNVGDYLSIFHVGSNRFYLATILVKSVLTITVDTPLDFAFPIGSFVTSGTRDMSVNGSVTPVIFGLRNTTEAIGTTFDITRIMFKCLTTTAPDLARFGNIATGLTKGIVLRKKDGVYHNIFNAKTNADLKNIMFDFEIEPAVGSAQDGFTGRLTFAGPSRVGVVIRLAPGEDIQMIVQDDLSSLELFTVIAEGHVTENL